MRRDGAVRHEFVEYIPDTLQEGVVYVSIRFATASHLCCCGCGTKVVTPIRPTDWTLIFDGKTISLHPSIGNWSFACRSHYWIAQNRVHWAGAWSDDRVAAGRALDAQAKDGYFGIPSPGAAIPPAGSAASPANPAQQPRMGWWLRLKRRFGF